MLFVVMLLHLTFGHHVLRGPVLGLDYWSSCSSWSCFHVQAFSCHVFVGLAFAFELLVVMFLIEYFNVSRSFCFPCFCSSTFNFWSFHFWCSYSIIQLMIIMVLVFLLWHFTISCCVFHGHIFTLIFWSCFRVQDFSCHVFVDLAWAFELLIVVFFMVPL